MIEHTQPSVTNWAHCFAMIFLAKRSVFKKSSPRRNIRFLHSSAVLSSNVANVMKRKNNSLAGTMAVIGWSDERIIFTADWIVECNSWTVSTV